MYVVGYPDWKKIGWHVGKRLKDILNPPKDTGPSREERRAQRIQDVLKGFAYFDDFDEVETWSEDAIDPIQVSNTPLIDRPAPGTHDQKGPSTPILLCHDYSGGYHDYESVRPPMLEDKLYNFNHHQYIDSFVYFSHKLVCIPPPTWTNTMHRNGTKVLGTFLVERHTPHIERLLQQKNGSFIVADQLARMAKAYGFDGWLLNIEAEFPSHTNDFLNRLTGFIGTLKQLLKAGGKVLWYDALTCDNKIDYQNTLTPKNLDYALAADALFTNYKWSVTKVEEARRLANKSGLETQNVLFGVDVWAQNTNMSGPSRVTFPSKGGGGTNTGVASSVLADRGFATAIFAPAWTHEHFSTTSSLGLSDAESVQRSMWEGWPLPVELGCDCRERMPHHTSLYMANPILSYARKYPAGSATYFESDFRGAFERKSGKDGTQLYPTLGSQAIMPKCLPMTASEWEKASTLPAVRVLYGELTEYISRGLTIQTKLLGKLTESRGSSANTWEQKASRLCLFKLNMPADGSLGARVVHKGSAMYIQADIGVYCAYKSPFSEDLEYHPSPIEPRTHSEADTLIAIKSEADDARLVELGFYCSGSFECSQPTVLCQILNVSIKPNEKARMRLITESIVNLHLVERGHPEHSQKRLAWEVQEQDDLHLASWNGLPWSRTTGPFAYFLVFLQGREIGRAYCTEFCFLDDDSGEVKQTDQGAEMEVIVRGILFGGGEVSSDPAKISLDWKVL